MMTRAITARNWTRRWICAAALFLLGAAGAMNGENRAPDRRTAALSVALIKASPVSATDLRLAAGENAAVITRHAVSQGGALGREYVKPSPVEGMDLSVAVDVRIDISEQEMIVAVDGVDAHVWPVSTGRRGHRTPTGVFQPQILSRHHRSSLYDDAPMPFSVFFNGDIAVHGTTAIRKLGRPDSHGCVRLHPDNAEILFNLVRAEGMERVVIRVDE